MCGKFLFYGRAVDNTILVALSAIASQQSKPTTDTMAKAKQLLDYLASQEEAILTYSTSKMVLAVHSDAGYLNEPNARSRAGGHFFLSNHTTHLPNNGAILNLTQIIKNVMSSATETALRALFITTRKAVYIRNILMAMGHKQPATPIQTDNLTAEGVINNKIQPKQTKAMDMLFHWLRDQETLKQFIFPLESGKLNLGDYWTKQHPASHHKNVRTEYITPTRILDELNSRKAQMESRESANKVFVTTQQEAN